MLLFRDEEHVGRWCEARDMMPGEVITVEQTWALAHGWYKDKVQPNWRRHTPEEAAELFASIGLTGPFWS